MSRGEQLPGLVSAVTPIGEALDGTSRVPARARRPAKAKPRPAVGTQWICPVCARPATDAADQARHVAQELKAIRAVRRSVVECGTISGYTAHRRKGEGQCGRCMAAWAVYWKLYLIENRDRINRLRREREARKRSAPVSSIELRA